jgi:hypothetical protein
MSERRRWELTLPRLPKLWGSGAGRGESAHAAVRRFSWVSAGAVTCGVGVPFCDREGTVARTTGSETAVVSASMESIIRLAPEIPVRGA